MHIHPGRYFERVRITRGGDSANPTCIRAIQPGTVTLTWEMDEEELKQLPWLFEDGIYSVPVDWPIYRVVWRGQQLFRVPWGGIAYFHKLSARPDSMGVFLYEQGRLHIALPPGQIFSAADFRLNADVPEPREWGEFKSANVTVSADYVELSGLSLEFGIGAGVVAWGTHHLRVCNCMMTGADYGIKSGSASVAIGHVTMENCFYHNFPQGSWNDKWLSWDEAYAHSNSSFANLTGPDIEIKDCVAVHVGDGVRIKNSVKDRTTIVEGNVIALGTDDAFEFDGAACGVGVRNNFIYDCYVGLSLSPLTAGPLAVESNFFWLQSPTTPYSAFVKILPPPKFADRTVQQVRIQDNAVFTNSVCWWCPCPIRDVAITNNFFAVRLPVTATWPPDVKLLDNREFDFAERGCTASDDLIAERFKKWNLADSPTEPGHRAGVSWIRWSENPVLRDVPRILPIHVVTDSN